MNTRPLLLILLLFASLATAWDAGYTSVAYIDTAVEKGINYVSNWNCTSTGATTWVNNSGPSGEDSINFSAVSDGCLWNEPALTLDSFVNANAGSVTILVNRTATLTINTNNRLLTELGGFFLFTANNATHAKLRLFDGGNKDVDCKDELPLNDWVTLTATWDGTNFYCYVNGSYSGHMAAGAISDLTNNFGWGDAGGGASSQPIMIANSSTSDVNRSAAFIAAETIAMFIPPPPANTSEVTITHPQNTTYYNTSIPYSFQYQNNISGETPGYGEFESCGYWLNGIETWLGNQTNSTPITGTLSTADGDYNFTAFCGNATGGNTTQYHNFTVLLTFNVTIYDEITGSLLGANLALSNSTDSRNFATGASSYLLNASTNYTLGNSILTGYNTSYHNRSYSLFLTPATYGSITLALIATANATAYTVYIRNIAGNAIPFASYNITRTVGGTEMFIGMGQTDANGIFTVYLQYGATYTFDLAATGYTSASTGITASALNPITIILYSGTGVQTWNTSLSSIIPEYWGQPLVQGQTSWRTANASYWLYDYLVFTGACVDYYWNATVLLNQSCGLTNNVSNVTVIIGATQTGLVLQKFTITANASNFTFLSWIPILPSGSGGSPEYKKGMITLIAEQLVLSDPTGLFAGGLAFIVLVGCLLVATYIGGPTIISTIIFLILLAIFTFVLPIMPWYYFMILGVVAFSWIYLKGGS